jgi:predicted transposase YbfD/YdcC
MRCTVKKTLKVAVESGNDVLVQLKGNQPSLLGTMEALSEHRPPRDNHHDDQTGQRNRIESRTTSVWPLTADEAPVEWPSIRCLVQVRRRTDVFNTTRGTWDTRSETAWYVCTRDLSAHSAAKAIRDHWLIENSLHHVRDVTFGEDASRIRRDPGVFAQLRTWTLNLFRQAGHDNIKAARQFAAWSPAFLLDLYQIP